MSAHVFQTDFPAAEAQAFATAVLTKTLSKALLRDAWVVAEYGLAMLLPAATGATDVVLVSTAEPCSEDEAIHRLLERCQAVDEGVIDLLPIPWSMIIQIAIQLILSLL